MQMPYIVHTANRYGPLIRNAGQLHTQTHISFPLWSQRVALQKQCEWGKVFLGGLQLQFKQDHVLNAVQYQAQSILK